MPATKTLGLFGAAQTVLSHLGGCPSVSVPWVPLGSLRPVTRPWSLPTRACTHTHTHTVFLTSPKFLERAFNNSPCLWSDLQGESLFLIWPVDTPDSDSSSCVKAACLAPRLEVRGQLLIKPLFLK